MISPCSTTSARRTRRGTPSWATSTSQGATIEVFGHGTDEPSRPLLPPGLCWICDQSPDQGSTKVIDTRRNSRPGQASLNVTERKYVCESCATELGSAVGMVEPEKFESASRAAANQSRVVNELTADLERERASQMRVVPVDEIVEVLRAELAKKTPAARKPAAKPGVGKEA